MAMTASLSRTGDPLVRRANAANKANEANKANAANEANEANAANKANQPGDYPDLDSRIGHLKL
ncbi:MAG: hypothetical protein Q9188_003096 [Gyalolechia gomerana]